MIETGTPVTVGVPFGNLRDDVDARQARRTSPRGRRRKRVSRTMPSPACSPMPRICVEPPVAHFSPTSESPRRMNRKASVTMKDGSRVRMTIWPLMAPRAAATTKVAAMAGSSGRPRAA